MRLRKLYLLVILLLFSNCLFAQQLKPGFEVNEYLGVLRRSVAHVGASYRGDVPKEVDFTRVYGSPVVGLHNKFDVWLSKDKTIMAVNLRGTTNDLDSWLENFYSAMIPAQGSITLSDSVTFSYKFARDPKAMVHVGWTVGLGSMAPDIVRKVNQFYGLGVKQVIVEGHSQGGALAFLLSAYLHYLVEDGTLPADLVIKTYCSAAPKPGNLYFAYDFDYNNCGGWGFNVVNSADWVPQTPFSLQTLADFNKLNPFSNAKDALRGQKLLVRLYATHVYNKLTRNTNRTRRKFQKYSGKMVYRQVKKYLPQYEAPKYGNSLNYARAGIPIVLQPGEAYYQKFPDTGSNVFRHHLFEPYYYLVKEVYK
jgi:hypothetical protein